MFDFTPIYPLGDNIGYVALVDKMGDDSAIVKAARVSYQKGTQSKRNDAELISYLLRHGHSSPLEQVVFKFEIKCPLFIARQWLRHRTLSANEISARYSEVNDEFYIPKKWRVQDRQNKQGSHLSTLENDWHESLTKNLREHNDDDYATYKDFLNSGVAREMSRMLLPQNMYTSFVYTQNLHNLFHFLRLRLDSHAQYEIQLFAQAIAQLVRGSCPLAYAAFEEHILNAVTFSASEGRALKRLLEVASGEQLEDNVKLVSAEWRKSLQDEFMQKIVALG